MKGTVKWFNDKKGYGFINEEGTNTDYFVHFSELKTEGFKTLKSGQVVEFAVGTNKDGKKMAIDVTVIVATPVDC